MKKHFYALTLIVLTLSSCMRDEYDLENLNTDAFQPSIALPLINSNFEFSSFLGGIDTMEMVEKDSNGLIHIIVEDSLFSYSASDLLSAPDQAINQSFGIEPIGLDSIHSNTSVALSVLVDNMSDPEKTVLQSSDGGRNLFPTVTNQAMNAISIPASDEFSSITLSSGILSIEITNNWPVEVTSVQIELRNASSNTVLDTFVYASIASGASETETSNLAGSTLENSLTANVISVSSPGSGLDSVNINLTDQLNLDIIFDSLEIVSGNAIFPSQEIYNDSIVVDFDLGNGEIISEVTLSEGSFTYDFEHSIQENASIRLQIPSLSKNGVSFDQLINLVPNGGTANTVDSVDLSGYVMDFSNGGDTNTLRVNIIANVISSNNLVLFDTSQSVSSDITIGNLKIQKFVGDIGQRQLALAADTMDMNISVDGLDGLSFASPSFSLEFNNSIGVPFDIDLGTLTMIDGEGTATSLTGTAVDDPIDIGAAQTEGAFEKTNITLNKDNSNIAALLSSAPEKIITNITANLNPDGPTSNFVLDTSKIDVTMGVDIPLHVSIDGFGMYDTMEIGTGMLQGFQLAEFAGKLDNGLPVDLSLQIYMMDSNYTILDSLITSTGTFASAAVTDAEGNHVSNTISDINIIADSAKVKTFNESTYLLMDFSLATPENGTKAVKLFTTASIGLQLGIKTKLSLSELELGGNDNE